MKENFRREYLRRTKLIMKSRLNGNKKIIVQVSWNGQKVNLMRQTERLGKSWRWIRNYTLEVKILIRPYNLIINKINRSLYIFCELEKMTNDFQINTVYSDLLSKVHYQSESLFTNQKSKKAFFTIGNISVKSVITQLKQYKSY